MSTNDQAESTTMSDGRVSGAEFRRRREALGGDMTIAALALFARVGHVADACRDHAARARGRRLEPPGRLAPLAHGGLVPGASPPEALTPLGHRIGKALLAGELVRALSGDAEKVGDLLKSHTARHLP